MGKSKTPGLSLARVRKDLRKKGITILSRNGEYCVKYKGAPTRSTRNFFTPDLNHAWEVGIAMAQRRDERRRRVLGPATPAVSPPGSVPPPPPVTEADACEQQDRARAAITAAVDAYGIAKTLVGLCSTLGFMNTPYTVRLGESLERFLDIARAADQEVYAAWVAKKEEK